MRPTFVPRFFNILHARKRKKSGERNQPHTDRRKKFLQTQRLSHARVEDWEGILSEREDRDSPRDRPLECLESAQMSPDASRTVPRTPYGRLD